MPAFDPYLDWLEIPRDRRPPNHYDLLGLPPFESSPDRLHDAYTQRYAHVRKYNLGEHAEQATRLLGELARAFDCLRDERSKAEYDLTLRAQASGLAPPPGPDQQPAADKTPPASLSRPAGEPARQGHVAATDAAAFPSRPLFDLLADSADLAWYLRSGDREFGPLTPELVRGWINDARDPDYQLRHRDWPCWLSLQQALRWPPDDDAEFLAALARNLSEEVLAWLLRHSGQQLMQAGPRQKAALAQRLLAILDQLGDSPPAFLSRLMLLVRVQDLLPKQRQRLVAWLGVFDALCKSRELAARYPALVDPRQLSAELAQQVIRTLPLSRFPISQGECRREAARVYNLIIELRCADLVPIRFVDEFALDLWNAIP